MPGIYKINCTGRKQVHANSGSGSASVSDSFNINPSSLPTEPSPYGIEMIGSYLRSTPSAAGFTFALIKGFHKIGTGISTNSNNTFFGNDVMQRGLGPSNITTFEPFEKPASSLPNLNLGTSYQLIAPKGSFKTSLSLGFSARYNKITSSLGFGLGFVVNSDYVILGGGFVNEHISNFLPAIQFYSGLVGLKYAFFEIEYTILQNSGGYSLSPIQIGAISGSFGPVILTAAIRSLNYLKEGEVTQTHYAVQVQVSTHFTVGYLVNQIPGTNSLACQVFL
jgi:hypothetical protein